MNEKSYNQINGQIGSEGTMRIARSWVAICIIVSVLCLYCTTAAYAKTSEPNAQAITTILGAFDKEITLLEDRLSDRKRRNIEGIRFTSGRLSGRDVVVAWTGVGKVNAAMTTTLLIEHFKPEHVLFTGAVVTGDAFIASTDKCAELRRKLDADAVEMEGAAVAQLCYQRRIGCLVIRSISDRADEGAVFDKQTFYLLAAKNSADFVAQIVGLFNSSPSIEGNRNNQRLGD